MRSSTHISETRIGQCLEKDYIDYGKGLRDVLQMISSGEISGTTKTEKGWRI